MKAKLINDNFTENYIPNLLKFYGIEDIEEYLTPSANALQDPEALMNIAEAEELLRRTCEKKFKILLIVNLLSLLSELACIYFGYTISPNHFISQLATKIFLIFF